MDLLTKIGAVVLLGATIGYTYNNSRLHEEHIRKGHDYAEVKTLNVVGHKYSSYNCQLQGKSNESAIKWGGNEFTTSEYREFLNKNFNFGCQSMFFSLYKDNKENLDYKVK